MFGEDLVVWIEPCVAHDADMRLKWVETLAKYGAVTGDELRELSPFDLPAGDFSQPVVVSSRERQQLEAARRRDGGPEEHGRSARQSTDPARPVAGVLVAVREWQLAVSQLRVGPWSSTKRCANLPTGAITAICSRMRLQLLRR